MEYYILKYYLVDDYLERRPKYREDHLTLATELHKKGELIFGGALCDPVDEALLIFKVVEKSIVENFVSNDPYVINGLVLKWVIRKWNVAIGKY